MAESTKLRELERDQQARLKVLHLRLQDQMIHMAEGIIQRGERKKNESRRFKEWRGNGKDTIKESNGIGPLYNHLERYWVPNSGEFWAPLGGYHDSGSDWFGSGFRDEGHLQYARNQCRHLQLTNEFAKNALENRVSYVIGQGHTYTVVPKDDDDIGHEEVAEIQRQLDRFVQKERWFSKQQEIQRRKDRDGEVFLRLFETKDEMEGEPRLAIRFVEPSMVGTPTEHNNDEDHSMGIQTKPDDVEMVLGYHLILAVDGQTQTTEFVPAEEIQHRKAGVDCNSKRGMPLLWCAVETLNDLEQIQRQMAKAAEIQTAIALIRRHETADKGTVEEFRDAMTDKTVSSGDDPTQIRKHVTQYDPGTILDAPQTIEYEFPAQGLDASRYVEVKQAGLRQVASMLLMPEFMLTSDASNANYSSTLVAEGPAVKYFERLQSETKHWDLELLWRHLEIVLGRDQASVLKDRVEIQVGMPRVSTRDEEKEARVNETYNSMHVKSLKTITGEIGLDFEQEQANIREERETEQELFPPLQMGMDDDGEFPEEPGTQPPFGNGQPQEDRAASAHPF